MNTIKQLKKMLLLLLITVSGINQTFATAPNWTVDPAAYQYNMTMLAVININCSEMISTGNRIGIFKDNECRGTALTSQVINGRYLASLFIYSNTVTGESLTFKVYDAMNDTVYETGMKIEFQQNSSYGNASSPFVVYSKFPCYFTKDILPVTNFISPDNDGKNDYFAIDDIDSYQDFSLTVYNESGLEVYKKAEAYKNDWSGTYEGKTLEVGAYYYIFKNSGNGKEYKGIINIVRSN